MGIQLSKLAKQTGSTLVGDDCQIDSIAEISSAGAGDIAFVSNSKYLEFVFSTDASALIIKPELQNNCSVPALVTDNPRLIYAKIANLLYPRRKAVAGISEHSFVSELAIIDESVSIAASTVIASGVCIASGAEVGAGCVIEENVIIGTNTCISANVTIGCGSKIGNDCIVHSGVVLGTDGFGFVKDGDSYLKIPQIGNVHIGDNVEIGANTTIDRGALELHMV